jgi:hypothetical protein
MLSRWANSYRYATAPDDSQYDGTMRDGSRALHFGFHGNGRGANRLRFSFPCRSTRAFLDAPVGLVPGESGSNAPHLHGARHWHHVAATYDAGTVGGCTRCIQLLSMA